MSNRDAAEWVWSIRGYRLLQGYRGHSPDDTVALEELLLLVEEVPQIAELDLNPLFAAAAGTGLPYCGC